MLKGYWHLKSTLKLKTQNRPFCDTFNFSSDVEVSPPARDTSRLFISLRRNLKKKKWIFLGEIEWTKNNLFTKFGKPSCYTLQDMTPCIVTFCLVWILVKSQTVIHAESDAYEPTTASIFTHRWAKTEKTDPKKGFEIDPKQAYSNPKIGPNEPYWIRSKWPNLATCNSCHQDSDLCFHLCPIYSYIFLFFGTSLAYNTQTSIEHPLDNGC